MNFVLIKLKKASVVLAIPLVMNKSINIGPPSTDSMRYAVNNK